MTDVQKVKLQRWWMEQLREITRKTMQAEDKRQQKAREKATKELADLSIERREDIDDLYGYGVITDRKREKLIELFDGMVNHDELYQAKIDLLQEFYSEAHRVMLDLGQEV
jgi:hypothetical protein